MFGIRHKTDSERTDDTIHPAVSTSPMTTDYTTTLCTETCFKI